MRELHDLPQPSRALLRTMASLGDRAAPPLLAVASGAPETDLAALLAPAAAAGFVRMDRGDWAFSHDRIREAVQAAVPSAERARRHLAIARRLSVAEPGSVPPFSLATQANLARPAVDDPAERRSFALLNLEAGRCAKAATAHHAALEFFGWALTWFGDEQTSADALQASLLCGEAEFMTGALEAAEMRLAALQGIAGDGLFGADVARLRAALYTTLGRFDLALDVGLAFLAKAGIELPRRPSSAQVDEEHARLCEWLDPHGVEALRDIPTDIDPLRRAIVDIFADLLPPALYSDQQLVDLMLLRMVRLAIAHGHTDASANGYVCLMQVLGARYGDPARGRAFGDLALHLVDERGLRRYEARVRHNYATFVVPWTAPARSAREHFIRAFDIATREGDHTFALYCGRDQATGMLFAGEFLEDVRQTVEAALVRARDAKFQLVVNSLLAQRTLLGTLQGEPRGERMAEPVDGAPATPVDLAYWVYRLQAGLLFGDLGEAIEARRRAEACQMAARAFAEFGDLPFYGALALLQLPARDAEQESALARHLAALDDWVAECPQNFGARRALVRAERARVLGQVAEAAELFALAVAEARGHGFTQVEALAAERAAAFHASLGREIERRAYLRHALANWQRWGAAAKARQLQLRHPELQETEVPGPASRLKAMGELVASIVHEIGQPLSSIDTSASAASRWLERDEPDIGEALAMVFHVRLSAKRAKTIIQGLRAMARKAEPQFGDVDLCDALRECVSLVGGSMTELGVTLAALGPARPCHVRGDRVQLQQVAINLLMNGAEAMAATEGPRRLTMRWGASQAGIRVEIEDRGPGIPMDAASQLTEPFFTTKAEGMGMGLAICKSIVDAHGGTLSFGPGSEGGTLVALSLPAAALADAAIASAMPVRTASTASAHVRA